MAAARLAPGELRCIAEGAALLGSGGGGTLQVAHQLIEVIAEVTGGQGVLVAEPPYGELASTDAVAVAADVGASDTFVPHQDLATLQAFTTLQAAVGGDFVAVVPGEVGPESSMAAAVVAAHLGVPVIDGDGAGRAIPSLPLCLFDVGGVRASPCAIAGTGPDSVVLRAPDAAGVEKMMRPILGLDVFDNSAGMALWAMDVETMGRLAIPGTLQLAGRIGRALDTARRVRSDPVAAVLAVPGVRGRLLASGTVAGENSQTEGGFDNDVITLEAPDGSTITVLGENESLVAWSSQKVTPLATAPDILGWLTPDGRPLTSVDVAKLSGEEVLLLGLCVDPRLWAPEALIRFRTVLGGLGYFGEPVPVLAVRDQ
jgi:uncharacterized protein